MSLLCCGLFTGIPAVVVGLKARREIADSSGRLGGDGLALGGIVTGILGTLWSLLLLVLALGLVIAGTARFSVSPEECSVSGVPSQSPNGVQEQCL